MAANTPEMYEAHFGVPMSGAVLNTLNTRLDAEAISFMLGHGEAKVLITDREFSPTIAAALAKRDKPPLVIDIDDPEYDGPGERLGELDYESFIAAGDPEYTWPRPQDEWQAISLNYTSGTTADPKGVVFHHRGAYLNGIGNMLQWGMPRHSIYLWTLPMFHCNGWCFPWTMAANAGTNVCLRRVDPALIFQAIREHRVTHYCGAPIVQSTILNAPAELRDGIDHKVSAMVAGAAPPTALLAGMERMGFDLTHVYGLTEVYGPASVCAKQDEWREMDTEQRAERNGRQGVRYTLEEGMTVMDPETMTRGPGGRRDDGRDHVPRQHHDEGLPEEPLRDRGGVRRRLVPFRRPRRDAARRLRQDQGPRQRHHHLRRRKHLLDRGRRRPYRHPAVLAAAVVAKPDEKWGETPCAFIELKDGAEVTDAEIIEHCRAHLARFKAPSAVVFGTLPKTSTGKIQKFILRDRVHSASAIEV